MKWATAFCLLLIITVAESQELQRIKSHKIDEPTEVSIDRSGGIYFATFFGDIVKINSDLEQKLDFSPPNPGTIHMLEAWQGLRLFSFHRDLQLFRLVNRNLSLHEDYMFPQPLIGFAEMATPSFDNNVWVIDQQDFSLVKYNIFSRRLVSRTPLDQILDPDNYEIYLCKEYQNKLFISTRSKGILIFDNLGSYIKTFHHQNISFFNFWKDQLYFIDDGELAMINLYNEQESTINLPEDQDWKFALVFSEKIYLFSKSQLCLFQ